ncbi:MAG: sulfite exporter TauE/SafE family protein [Phycisphaerales bacterium]|nr:sulfite exporter TauE/SafE family protein [Phycisphaerales bacterium]
MVFAIIGAVVVGVTLGLLGSGGSILTVPVLVYLVHRPDKNAIVESLAIVGVIALSGALTRVRKKEVDFGAAGLFALASIPGAWIGGEIGARIPGALQLVILAATMLVSAALMLRGKSKKKPASDEKDAPGRRRHPLIVIPVGLGVGMLTGTAGVGGGFLFVPALTVAAGLDIRRAIGTSLLLISINCATSFYKYLAHRGALEEPIDWMTIAIFGVVGVAGALVGQRLGSKISREMLRKIFAVFLVVLGAYMLWRETMSLMGR